MKITKIFKDFFNSESSGGIILISTTITTFLVVNLILGDQFSGFWKNNLFGKPLDFWVNDVLMTFFFLLIGFEIEREIYIGELSDIKQALLPIIAAIGGMFVPALLYIAINISSGNITGFGVPMATDIAFTLTILIIFGKRLPVQLRIFLTALAIIDDLGAIIIIAIFYAKGFSFLYISLALAIFIMLLIFNRYKIYNLLFYFIPGIFMWICIYKSGIHPTITGVLLAFAIPFGDGSENSPSYKIQIGFHRPVAYIILPCFAIANTGIIINSGDFNNLFTLNSIGIIVGLTIGKPLGIFTFSYIAVKLKISNLFENLSWKNIFGAGIIAGIGFTMSIFIAILAFDSNETIKASKLAILFSSCISAISGIIFFSLTSKNNTEKKNYN